MGAVQDQLYRRCACKLERVLSKRDCDLRILVGHSNMLQSLTPALTLEYDDDVNDDDDGNHCHHNNEWGNPNDSRSECVDGSDLIAFSEHVEDLFPVLREVSVTATELPSDEDGTSLVHQCVIEKSHNVMRAASPARSKSRVRSVDIQSPSHSTYLGLSISMEQYIVG